MVGLVSRAEVARWEPASFRKSLTGNPFAL